MIGAGPLECGARLAATSRRAGTMQVLANVGESMVALPITGVVETMRPLPVESVRGVPEFVLGMAVYRGQPAPVIDLGALLGPAGRPSGRFIAQRARGRLVLLAVQRVAGVRHVPDEVLGPLPSLVAGAIAEHVAAIGALDRQLLLALRTARLVPSDVWQRIETQVGKLGEDRKPGEDP